MFCANCGEQISDSGRYCRKCGAALPAPPTTIEGTPATQATGAGPARLSAMPPPHTSGMAVAALVLGVASILVFFLSIPAIIFGFIGISRTNTDPNLKGRGLAVTGLILGIVVAVFWIVLLLWLFYSLS